MGFVYTDQFPYLDEATLYEATEYLVNLGRRYQRCDVCHCDPFTHEGCKHCRSMDEYTNIILANLRECLGTRKISLSDKNA